MIYEYNGSNLGDGLYFFYAAYNSKCNVLAERINKLNNDYKNLNIYRVNTTKYMNIKNQLSVTKIPSYLLIKNQSVISRKDGNVDYYTLKQWLKERV